MSDIIEYRGNGLLKIEPREDIVVRRALPGGDDFGWIDALQKANSHGLGFMARPWIETQIERGNVFVAEVKSEQGKVKSENTDRDAVSDLHFSLCASHSAPRPAGYCIAVDRYMKQDHVGIIYQMCVAPEYRRSLVAARLLQYRFDTSAYGTRLYSCWCRQDLEANRFWEAMGFVPIAFRAAGRSTLDKIKRKTGSTSGGVHIFWQKRVRLEDQSTEYWYPCETSGGAMAEGRVVLPIPPAPAPGSSWRDVMPVVLPGEVPGVQEREEKVRLLEAEGVRESPVVGRQSSGGDTGDRIQETGRKKGRRAAGKQDVAKGSGVTGRVVGAGGFGVAALRAIDPGGEALVKMEQSRRDEAAKEKQRLEEERRAAKRAMKEAMRKNDPQLVAYARELRDRWQEHVAANPALLEDKQAGKYAVGRLPEVSALKTINDPAERQNVRRLAA